MAIVYQNGVAGKICANPECNWKPLSEFPPRRVLGIPAGDGYTAYADPAAVKRLFPSG